MSGPASEDPDIEMIKARKLRELKAKAAALERSRVEKQEKPGAKTAREVVLRYLYDRGDEVLGIAEAQYPAQTQAILARIAELIERGEIQDKISGGELLAIFRSVGLRVRVNTSIKVEDRGKLISFSDKLKQKKD